MSNTRQGTNYYEVLEVDRDAPQNEIHQAYQRAKATYSGDNPALYSMFSKEEARELIRMIEEAYAVLGNHQQRRVYDETLSGQPRAQEKVPVVEMATATPPKAAQSNKKPHEQLPEISLADSTIGESYIVRKRDEPKTSLPPGSARTAFSVYKVDEEFEARLKETEDWDGALLQRIRSYKNLTLEQLSDATRVSKTYLGAVEANDYKKLPAPVFVRGFVVQMARILGLDENRVATSYMKILKAKTGQ